MNTFYLFAAISIMLIIILRDILKRKYNIDMDNMNLADFKLFEVADNKTKKAESNLTIKKNTGNNSLVLLDAGDNKVTVMATLRQITGLDYSAAKNLVNSVPSIIMTGISDKEADLTKKALEFVGAKIEIK